MFPTGPIPARRDAKPLGDASGSGSEPWTEDRGADSNRLDSTVLNPPVTREFRMLCSRAHGVAICLTAGTFWLVAAEPVLARAGDVVEAATAGELDKAFGALAKTVQEQVRGAPTKAVTLYASGAEGSLAIMQWTLLERVGEQGRKSLAADHPQALAWLLGDRDALQTLLSAGDPSENRWPQAVGLLCGIVEDDAEAKSGVPLRIAVATAMTFAAPVTSFADKQPIEALPRYRAFRDWNAAGVLFPSFRELTAWEMRYVVGSWAREDELVWARGAIRGDLKNRGKIGEAAFMVQYTEKNRSGASVQDEAKFYDSKPVTLPLILEYGAVCGGISKFGSAMCQAFGVPALPVGQPGHCAFIWQREDRSWALNNDISGWAESSRHDGIHTTWGTRAWFMPLMQAVQKNPERFVAAERLRAVAALADQNERADILAAACRACPLDFAAWLDRAAAMRAAAAKPADWKTAAKEAAGGFSDHPAAYAVLLASMDDGLMPQTATPAERRRFAVATAGTLSRMAASGADPSLIADGLRTTLIVQGRAVAPGQDNQIYRIIFAEPAAGEPIKPEDSKEIVSMFVAAVDALDADKNGPARAAWRTAAERTARGLIFQPGTRDNALTALQATVRRLQNAKRIDDARWLADRLMDALKQAGDAASLETATDLRKSLG